MARDYRNYDYITVACETGGEGELYEFYESFGWTSCDKKSGRGKEWVTFSRPHRIENKDRLQYLQVSAETANNRLARLTAHRHSFSVIFGLITLPFGGIVLLAGLTYAINMARALATICGILIAMAGLAVLIFGAFVLRKLVAQENANFERTRDVTAKLILDACDEAEGLLLKRSA